MKGWFDAFRESGGPTFYSAYNRTAATVDVRIIVIVVVFITLYAAFLIIFPGVRKERFSTFTMVTISLFTGAVILGCNFSSSWSIATVQITSAYRSFSSERVTAFLGIYVAFNSVNITLRGVPDRNGSNEIDFNERFRWDHPMQLKKEYREALVKGLPFPLLTVLEYFSMDQAGLSWGKQYRQAGYYGKISLWSSFALWFWMWILFCVVPRYGAYAMSLTGSLMITTNLIYYLNVPSPPLVIPFERVSLVIGLGPSFWLVLITGCVAMTTGISICILDWTHPNKFSHILEIDYGTPYDRHTIIKESDFTRSKKERSNRLMLSGLRKPSSTKSVDSKYVADPTATAAPRATPPSHPRGGGGYYNETFEMDVPRTPWKHSRVMHYLESGSTTNLQRKLVSFQDGGSEAAGGIGERNRMNSYSETGKFLDPNLLLPPRQEPAGDQQQHHHHHHLLSSPVLSEDVHRHHHHHHHLLPGSCGPRPGAAPPAGDSAADGGNPPTPTPPPPQTALESRLLSRSRTPPDAASREGGGASSSDSDRETSFPRR